MADLAQEMRWKSSRLILAVAVPVVAFVQKYLQHIKLAQHRARPAQTLVHHSAGAVEELIQRERKPVRQGTGRRAGPVTIPDGLRGYNVVG